MKADTDSQQTFADVPRELFIPEVIWVEESRVGGYVAVSRSDEPGRWGELVAADEPVVTQIDDGHTLPGSVGRSPSSSCSKPSILADMLRALDVHPGHAVLEIGTGTGWNVALLCERVGTRGRVVSVEIDAALADAARAALRRAGSPASVITTDGAAGYPSSAPYDRIISTAAVRWEVPRAWLEQTRPGGLIVTRGALPITMAHCCVCMSPTTTWRWVGSEGTWRSCGSAHNPDQSGWTRKPSTAPRPVQRR